MKSAVLLMLSSVLCFGQTTPPVTSPTIPLPLAVSVVGEYNQLATQHWAMGLSALYPVIGSIGMYGTTTADVVPVKAIDPTTKLSFYAISASVRQGIHEKLLSTGKFTFLLGGDVGPGFSSSPTGGISISATGSFVATALYRVNSYLSIVMPVRMLYISNAGPGGTGAWNPVLQLGVSFNLRKLPPPVN